MNKEQRMSLEEELEMSQEATFERFNAFLEKMNTKGWIKCGRCKEDFPRLLESGVCLDCDMIQSFKGGKKVVRHGIDKVASQLGIDFKTKAAAEQDEEENPYII